jgi:hypothetical protein
VLSFPSLRHASPRDFLQVSSSLRASCPGPCSCSSPIADKAATQRLLLLRVNRVYAGCIRMPLNLSLPRLYLFPIDGRTLSASMQDAHAQIRNTLEYVMASDMPAQHKSVLIEALTQALRNQLDADEEREQRVRQAAAPWQADEVAQLCKCLEGQVARSWQHADELAMRLALQLQRNVDDVRAKASELGLDASIRYRRASVAESSEME